MARALAGALPFELAMPASITSQRPGGGQLRAGAGPSPLHHAGLQGLERRRRGAEGAAAAGPANLAGREVKPLVDDSYNANPDSVRAAIDQPAGAARAHWLVLGTWARWATRAAFHPKSARYARERGISHAWVRGEACRHAAAVTARMRPLVPGCRGGPAQVAALPKAARFMQGTVLVRVAPPH